MSFFVFKATEIKLSVMDFRIDFIKAHSMVEIREGVFDVLMKYEDLLPRSMGANFLNWT